MSQVAEKLRLHNMHNQTVNTEGTDGTHAGDMLWTKC